MFSRNYAASQAIIELSDRTDQYMAKNVALAAEKIPSLSAKVKQELIFSYH